MVGDWEMLGAGFYNLRGAMGGLYAEFGHRCAEQGALDERKSFHDWYHSSYAVAPVYIYTRIYIDTPSLQIGSGLHIGTNIPVRMYMTVRASAVAMVYVCCMYVCMWQEERFAHLTEWCCKEWKPCLKRA